MDCVGDGGTGVVALKHGSNKTRNYLVNTPAAHGKVVPICNVEEQPNNCNEAPILDCVGSWGDYGSCNASCGEEQNKDDIQ